MKIFISHSSKDKIIIDSFVENILIAGCGIHETNIFCTSIEGLGIRSGSDFRQHILSELCSAQYSLLMISNNYKTSDICLNEMGASWAISGINVKPLLFPNLGFTEIGTLYSVNQAVKLNDSYGLDELFEEFTTAYQISKSTPRWNKSKSNFLAVIEKYSQTENKNNFVRPNEYFSTYLKENISVVNLFMKAHPTLLDCKAVFSRDYYRKVFELYCNEFEMMTEGNLEPLFPKYSSFSWKTNNSTDIMHGNNKFAGGMRTATNKGLFNFDVEFYKVEFLKNKDSEAGISFSVFCYLNGRWVFFPKPWRFAM